MLFLDTGRDTLENNESKLRANSAKNAEKNECFRLNIKTPDHIASTHIDGKRRRPCVHA